MAHTFHRDDATWAQVDFGDVVGSVPASSVTGLTTVSSATQTQMEAASVTSVFVSPGNVIYSPSVAKAWVRMNAIGTIVASNNISNVTSNGDGDLTITFTNAFSSSNYAYAVNAGNISAGRLVFAPYSVAPTSTTFRMAITDAAFNFTSVASCVTAIFFGDLP